MFKNLKKRVEQEGGEGLLAAVASGAVSSMKSPLSSIRSTSRESLNDLGNDRRMSISSTATPIPEEAGVDELQRKIARLQTALDRQQTGFDRRLKRSEEEFEERVKQVETSWQAKYDLLKENLTAVLDKSARLEEEWPALEARAKEGDGYKEKLIILQDELDTMQGLQNQEIAKVKHLLIQKEKEFVDEQKKARELDNALAQARKDAEALTKDLENLRSSQRSCSELQDRCDSLQFQLDSSEAKRLKETQEHDSLVSELREKVSAYEKRLSASELGDDDRVHALTLERAGLEKKLEETREQLNNVKATWSTKIDALERQISHLNSSKAEESAENEKLVSSLRLVEEERDKLKTELTEASSKVVSLEAQCAELGSKVGGLAGLEEQLTASRTELDGLRASDGQLRDEVSSLKELVEQLKPYRVRAESAESSLSNLEQQLCSLKEGESRLVTAKEEIDKLRASEEELVSKLKRRENKLASAEQELERLKPFPEAARRAEEQLSEAKTRIESLEKRVSELDSVTAVKELAEREVLAVKELSRKLEEEIGEYRRKEKELESSLESSSTRCHELEGERDQLMMRNAEMSQALEMSKRLQKESEERAVSVEEKFNSSQAEVASLSTRLADAENWPEDKVEKLEAVVKARQTVELLEEQLVEKNKTIRLQNQRINDMKKTLQKELNKASSNGPKQNSVAPGDSSSEESGLPNSNYSRSDALPPPTLDVSSSDDVNFTYMKNVVLHILTSKGSEALHMTKALATVLKLSPDEERLVKDTLEWRLSWFGQKPDLTKLL